MTKYAPIAIRLTETELAALDDTLLRAKYPTRTAVIRAGLDLLFAKHSIKQHVIRSIANERRQHPPRTATQRRD